MANDFLIRLVESVVDDILQEAQPEAPKDAPYGQYLFAPKRKDLSPEERSEKNTEEEEDLLDGLWRHYKADSVGLGREADKAAELAKKGWYNKILVPPSGPVYRLITDVSVSEAAAILGVDEKELLMPLDPYLHFDKGGVVQPEGRFNSGTQLSSWSTFPRAGWILKDLRPFGLFYGQAAILLKANTAGNKFIINPDGIQDVENMPDFAYRQDEVIGVGPIKFDEAVVFIHKDEEREDDVIPPQEYLSKLLGKMGL